MTTVTAVPVQLSCLLFQPFCCHPFVTADGGPVDSSHLQVSWVIPSTKHHRVSDQSAVVVAVLLVIKINSSNNNSNVSTAWLSCQQLLTERLMDCGLKRKLPATRLLLVLTLCACVCCVSTTRFASPSIKFQPSITPDWLQLFFCWTVCESFSSSFWSSSIPIFALYLFPSSLPYLTFRCVFCEQNMQVNHTHTSLRPANATSVCQERHRCASHAKKHIRKKSICIFHAKNTHVCSIDDDSRLPMIIVNLRIQGSLLITQSHIRRMMKTKETVMNTDDLSLFKKHLKNARIGVFWCKISEKEHKQNETNHTKR